MLAAGTAAAQQRYIVRTSPEKARQIADRYGLTVLRAPDSHGIALLGTSQTLRTTANPVQSLKSDPDVGGLELDGNLLLPEHPQLNQSTVAILDSLPRTRNSTTYFQDRVWTAYPDQWAAEKIHVTEAQRFLGAIGAGTVAVIDTGIDARHSTLASSMVNGYDFIRDVAGLPSDLADLNQSTVAILDRFSSSPLANKTLTAYVNQSTVAILDQSTVAILDGLRITAPAFGHGTMVAGLVHLVAPNTRLMPLKAFSADGSGSLYDVIRAIYYAVDHGAKVINMSFSLESSSEELEKALAYANARRVICVSSAGNSGKPVIVYPAGYRTVGGIGSTSKFDLRSSFSNYGDRLVTLAAPGENLITTYPAQGWAMVSGTSFSTALVAGAAALMVQFNGNTNQVQAENALSQAVMLPGQQLGAGRLDLFRACIYARIGHRW